MDTETEFVLVGQLSAARDEIDYLRAENDRLRDELASATRHMELAEAAWLRETSGNGPTAIILTPQEREAIESLGPALKWYPEQAAVLIDLLERAQ